MKKTGFIQYTSSQDCGCEITEAEYDSLLELIEEALEEAYPAATVTVQPGLATRCLTSDDIEEQEVRDIAQRVWEQGKFWTLPAEHKARKETVEYIASRIWDSRAGKPAADYAKSMAAHDPSGLLEEVYQMLLEWDQDYAEAEGSMGV